MQPELPLLEYILSQKYKPMLLVDGHPFQRVQKELTNEHYIEIEWRCRERRVKDVWCPVTCKTKNDLIFVQPRHLPHVCSGLTSAEIIMHKSMFGIKDLCKNINVKSSD